MIAVWFSCGVASAVAAKLTLDRYPNVDVRILNSPVIEEHHDNLRFLADVREWLGVPIERVTNKNYPECSAVDVWERSQWMGNIKGANCTRVLKKEARYQWESEHHPDWHVLGFTADEKHRYDRFILTERDNCLPILIDADVTKDECFKIIARAGIKRPMIYDLGYPNANCIGCIKATSPEYWNHVRTKHPSIFAHRAEQSRRIGARLVRVKSKRLFLDELKVTDRGRPMKDMNIDCGIFCEEVRT